MNDLEKFISLSVKLSFYLLEEWRIACIDIHICNLHRGRRSWDERAVQFVWNINCMKTAGRKAWHVVWSLKYQTNKVVFCPTVLGATLLIFDRGGTWWNLSIRKILFDISRNAKLERKKTSQGDELAGYYNSLGGHYNSNRWQVIRAWTWAVTVWTEKKGHMQKMSWK